jgi:Glycosyl hydrolase family 14
VLSISSCRGRGGPHDAGDYNSRFWETRFFCDNGRWASKYGQFFLGWYSGLLVRHADVMLGAVKDVLKEHARGMVLEAVEQVKLSTCCWQTLFIVVGMTRGISVLIATQGFVVSVQGLRARSEQSSSG